MTYRLTIILIVGLLMSTIEACSEKKTNSYENAVLKTQLDSVAYGIGMNFGKNLLNDSLMIDINAFARGINDILYGDTTLITDQELNKLMMAFQQQMQMKQQEKQARASADNKVKGEKFLAENKNKPGVKTTASGLQYIVIKEGSGAQPVPEDTVEVHYTGKFLDGKVFDSSLERNEPVKFTLNRVIKGWTEGMQLMKVGSKYQFFIPSEIAYGPQGAPPQIGPNETLIFEVELISIPGKK